MPSDAMCKRIRIDLLYRLRWNLLADLHDIEIMVGSNNEERLVPLFDHPSVDTDLGTPAVSRVEVMSEDCRAKYERSCDGTPEPDGYQPPPSLIIENGDGQSITLRQFVTEVHAYINEQQDDIKEALREIYTTPSEEMAFIFHRAWPFENNDGSIRMPVKLMPQLKPDSWEAQWASQLIQARVYERKRHNGQ